MLQGRQYNQEENLAIGATANLFKGKMSVSLIGTIPVETLLKRTYTKTEIAGFSQTTWNNMKVNSSLVMFNVKWNIGNNRAHRSEKSVNNPQEKKY